MGELLIDAALSEFERELENQRVDWLSRSAPGLEEVEIEPVLAKLGLAAPTELKKWFGWRNGVPLRGGEPGSHRALGPWEYLPLDEAASLHRQRGSFGKWFPIAAAGRRAVVCDCSSPSELCPVRVDDLEYVETPLEARSLADAVSVWISALQTRAWEYSEADSGSMTDLSRLPAALQSSRLV